MVVSPDVKDTDSLAVFIQMYHNTNSVIPDEFSELIPEQGYFL
jgi:hypothetical protein